MPLTDAVNNKVNEWFNTELQAMKREKIIKYLKASIENFSQPWAEYEIIRNRYKVQIENSKNNHINTKTECKYSETNVETN